MKRAFTQKVVAGLAVVAAVVGMNLVTAGTAAAAQGAWLDYGNNNPITVSASNWRCAPTLEIGDDMVAQVCAIRSRSRASVQGAVIVRNNGDDYYRTWADVDLYSTTVHLNRWSCGPANIRPNVWAVCFGETIAKRASVRAGGLAHFTDLGYSPWI